MSSFALPDLGEGLQEAELVAWHVAEGDHVVADQPLVSVETEKAVVEVPSPQAGRIARLLAKPGDRVKVGALIVVFEEGAHADTGTVVGELTERSSTANAAPTKGPVLASPSVRALARERGVDLARVAGSGPGGTVTRADVERIAGGGAVAGEPLKGVRRAMAVNMARAHAEIVPATLWDEADVESWWSPEADVTVRLIRAIGAACAAVPALNARYDGKSMIRQLLPRIDLGIAVDTEEGLIVPVLRDIAKRNLGDLRRGLDTLKAATRARGVALADLRDPTITLSNFGTLAGRHAVLVILPPQVAIIGAGRIEPQAVPRQEGVAFRPMLPLSITFDHRVVTGGEAARFLKAMIEDLQRGS
jgi:2-oxoisovalerate dehydrogenase E2 component (dihydrolipoyl transacylase)